MDLFPTEPTDEAYTCGRWGEGEKEKGPVDLFPTEPTDEADTCGRWGEVEKEKGPVDLFPTEPTDEARKGEETLDPGSKELLRPCKKRTEAYASVPFFPVRKMGLEPTRKHYAQDP